MSMHSQQFNPQLDSASVHDPACIEAGDTCPAFYYAHQLSQKEVSYYHQFDYGHYVSWFFVALLGVFMLVYGHGLVSERVSTKRNSNFLTRLACKVRAVTRYFTYRRMPGTLSDKFGMPNLGITMLILLFTLYCLLLSFWARPYYRQHRGYGSPPLAVRTGLMAVALTPWIIALSGKANLITMLTGIGHERLNVLHRWIGRICLGLSVIHTIPFIVAPLKDGGYAALHKQFYKPGAFEYTGVPPLAMLFGIVVMSVPFVRHRVYETFYFTHFLLGVSYVGLMFWHAGMEGDSWTYLWVTIAVWILSILIRVFWFNRATNIQQPRWFEGQSACIVQQPGDVTKIQVTVPNDSKAKPGQHLFLRFPAVSAFDNHPFSKAWEDNGHMGSESKFGTPTLTFFARSRAGFTKQLLARAKDQEQYTSVWLDGPYGGISTDLAKHFDHIVLIAGGIGITGCLSWMQELTKQQASKISISSMKFIWVISAANHVQWVEDYLQQLSDSAPSGLLTIEIHCTYSLESPAESPCKEVEMPYVDSENGEITVQDDISLPSSALRRELNPGRPQMSEVIKSLPGGKVAVIGCGPTSLKVDLSNACARAQRRVMSGELDELFLLTETFGW